MPTNYTGAAGNVSLATAVQISEVADGDPDSAASFTPAFQKLADYEEALRLARSAAIGSLSSGAAWAVTSATPLEISAFTAAQSANYGAGITGNNATGRITVANAGTYRIEFAASVLSTVASTRVSLVPRKNGVVMTGPGALTGYTTTIATPTGFDATTIAAIVTDTAAAGDYYSLWITSDKTGTITFFPGTSSFVVTRLF